MIPKLLKRTPLNKRCSKCKKTLPISEFDRSEKGYANYKYACKPCMN